MSKQRAVTDRAGAYTIGGLDADLVFELAVIHDGHMATFVKRVDPSAGPAPVAVLAPRTPVDDPARVFRGRVVGPGGRPLRLAVIEPFALDDVFELNSHLPPLSTENRNWISESTSAGSATVSAISLRKRTRYRLRCGGILRSGGGFRRSGVLAHGSHMWRQQGGLSAADCVRVPDWGSGR